MVAGFKGHPCLVKIFTQSGSMLDGLNHCPNLKSLTFDEPVTFPLDHYWDPKMDRLDILLRVLPSKLTSLDLRSPVWCFMDEVVVPTRSCLKHLTLHVEMGRSDFASGMRWLRESGVVNSLETLDIYMREGDTLKFDDCPALFKSNILRKLIIHYGHLGDYTLLTHVLQLVGLELYFCALPCLTLPRDDSHELGLWANGLQYYHPNLLSLKLDSCTIWESLAQPPSIRDFLEMPVNNRSEFTMSLQGNMYSPLLEDIAILTSLNSKNLTSLTFGNVNCPISWNNWTMMTESMPNLLYLNTYIDGPRSHLPSTPLPCFTNLKSLVLTNCQNPWWPLFIIHAHQRSLVNVALKGLLIFHQPNPRLFITALANEFDLPNLISLDLQVKIPAVMLMGRTMVQILTSNAPNLENLVLDTAINNAFEEDQTNVNNQNAKHGSPDQSVKDALLLSPQWLSMLQKMTPKLRTLNIPGYILAVLSWTQLSQGWPFLSTLIGGLFHCPYSTPSLDIAIRDYLYKRRTLRSLSLNTFTAKQLIDPFDLMQPVHGSDSDEESRYSHETLDNIRTYFQEANLSDVFDSVHADDSPLVMRAIRMSMLAQAVSFDSDSDQSSLSSNQTVHEEDVNLTQADIPNGPMYPNQLQNYLVAIKYANSLRETSEWLESCTIHNR